MSLLHKKPKHTVISDGSRLLSELYPQDGLISIPDQPLPSEITSRKKKFVHFFPRDALDQFAGEMTDYQDSYKIKLANKYMADYSEDNLHIRTKLALSRLVSTTFTNYLILP